MTYFLLEAHSGWRWIVLILIVMTAVKALIGWLANHKWGKLDTRLLLSTRIALYIQVVLGLLLYILQQRWTDEQFMQFTGEHVVIALLAVGAVEFGAARAKKSTGSKMYMFAFIGTALALVLVYVALLAVGGIFV